MTFARMWRGPLVFALMMVALALVAPPHASVQNAHPDQKRSPYAWEPAQPVSFVTQQQAVEPARYKRPCEGTADDRQSDLCAQWKAVDWARASTLIGTVGAIGIVFALLLTIQSNMIARDTARRQLRAYVTVEPGGITEPMDGKYQVPFNIINNGQTPAYELEHGGDFLVVTGDPKAFDPRQDGRVGDQAATTDAILGPHQNRFSYAYLDEEVLSPWLDKVFRKEAALIHYGFLSYRDAFGEKRRTNFAFYHWGTDLSADFAKRCRFGNDAT